MFQSFLEKLKLSSMIRKIRTMEFISQNDENDCALR